VAFTYDARVLQPLRGSLDDKLRRIVDILQVIAEDESSARGRVAEARASDEYLLAYEEPEPLVSIVMPTYLSWETLRDVALPSALAQTYENIEVVVVGDSAPSETREVIRALGDPRVRFENLPMRGPYPDEPERRWLVSGTPPFNAAVHMARGRWIAPCADDDALVPEHVEWLLAEARERRIELVYGRLRVHTPSGETTVVGDFPPRLGEFGLQGALYHAGLGFDLHLADELFDIPNDWALCRRMMRAGVRIGMIDAVVTDYYPSVDWGRRERPPEPELEISPELEAARNRADDLQRELDDAHAQLDGALRSVAELDEVRAYVEELELRLGSMQSQLDVITSSKSWRVTRPLRQIAARRRARQELG
jgi:Glycosyl transferase family 2